MLMAAEKPEFYDYEFDAISHRGNPVRFWAHPDDFEAEVGRRKQCGYTDITWRLRTICEETYRICYGDR